jgi:hypothetical protein
MFWKIVVLYEIYSKELQWPNTFCTSLYAMHDIINLTRITTYVHFSASTDNEVI